MTGVLNINFPDHSRVWIYQPNRKFSEDEIAVILTKGKEFTANWSAHGNALLAGVYVIYDIFLVLVLDETQSGATGCSIDKSVYFIKEIEKEFSVQLTNRLLSAVVIDEEIKILATAEIKELVEKNIIDEETPVFDNTIQTLLEMKTSWKKQLGKTWLKKYVVFT